MNKKQTPYFICNHCNEMILVKSLKNEVECPDCLREVNIDNAESFGITSNLELVK